MGKKAFLFPGQGAQYVGMAKDLFDNSAEAREMIKMADDAAGVNLSFIMFNGPEDNLKQTEYTQPAIFVHSTVLASLIRTIQPEAAAGHSLGEYSALVAAGSIQFYDAVRLVRERGMAMQAAGIQFPGTMAAVVGLSPDKVKKFCEDAADAGIVQCANFNSPGQIVISGSVDGVRKAMELSKAGGAKMVKELVVSGAFHSPLMEPAKERLLRKIESSNIYDAKFPVYSNVTAQSELSQSEIRSNLFEQLTSPVRWEEIVNNMINDGVDEFYEVGPGKVLQGLVKRINPDAKCFGIDKYADVEKYL